MKRPYTDAQIAIGSHPNRAKHTARRMTPSPERGATCSARCQRSGASSSIEANGPDVSVFGKGTSCGSAILVGDVLHPVRFLAEHDSDHSPPARSSRHPGGGRRKAADRVLGDREKSRPAGTSKRGMEW